MIEHIKLRFIKNSESIQYNVALTITGAVRGTSSKNSIKS